MLNMPAQHFLAVRAPKLASTTNWPLQAGASDRAGSICTALESAPVERLAGAQQQPRLVRRGDFGYLPLPSKLAGGEPATGQLWGASQSSCSQQSCGAQRHTQLCLVPVNTHEPLSNTLPTRVLMLSRLDAARARACRAAAASGPAGGSAATRAAPPPPRWSACGPPPAPAPSDRYAMTKPKPTLSKLCLMSDAFWMLSSKRAKSVCLCE